MKRILRLHHEKKRYTTTVKSIALTNQIYRSRKLGTVCLIGVIWTMDINFT